MASLANSSTAAGGAGAAVCAAPAGGEQLGEVSSDRCEDLLLDLPILGRPQVAQIWWQDQPDLWNVEKVNDRSPRLLQASLGEGGVAKSPSGGIVALVATPLLCLRPWPCLT